jgi:dihydrofolate synthase/folylpolyglutamate synthase
MNPDLPDFSSFEATIDALFSRVRGHIEPGSHRMQVLASKETLDRLARIPTILVAGTNGKGTTCALLEQSFREAGYRTALYTSPHLLSPTERIRISGVPISKETFLESARHVFEAAQIRLPDATFFELMTALAFEVFASAQIDVFVCEVGLGGRLDSTNVLSPWVSVLTSVGLDHTEWLGPTEKTIAFEKSFVSRRNKSLVVGSISEVAKEGLSQALAITGARPVFVEFESDPTRTSEALVLTVLEEFARAGGPKVTESIFNRACSNYFWPGRMDVREVAGVKVMLDAAHNSHGVNYLLQQLKNRPQLRELPHPRILVYATLADKDWPDVLKQLAPAFDTIHLTQTQSPRAVQVNDLIQYISGTMRAAQVKAHISSSEALTEGLKSAQLSSGSLFILGSITLLGEAMEFLSIPVFPEQGRASL